LELTADLWSVAGAGFVAAGMAHRCASQEGHGAPALSRGRGGGDAKWPHLEAPTGTRRLLLLLLLLLIYDEKNRRAKLK